MTIIDIKNNLVYKYSDKIFKNVDEYVQDETVIADEYVIPLVLSMTLFASSEVAWSLCQVKVRMNLIGHNWSYPYTVKIGKCNTWWEYSSQDGFTIASNTTRITT